MEAIVNILTSDCSDSPARPPKYNVMASGKPKHVKVCLVNKHIISWEL